MSTSERDTHFKDGFANLLMQELDEQVGAVTTWGLEHDIDSQEKIGQELYSRWQTLIAQRAYDLIFSLYKSYPGEVEMAQWGGPSDQEIHDHIAVMPDLTKWPEPEQGGAT